MISVQNNGAADIEGGKKNAGRAWWFDGVGWVGYLEVVEKRSHGGLMPR